MEKTDMKHAVVGSEKKSKEYKWDIVWMNILILAILHICAIYGYVLKFSGKWQTIFFSKVMGSLSTLAVTGGAHRLWAHRAYKANKFVEILLTCMMCMTYQNSIYIWCRDHRLHHKYSETDADPHNAKRGFFFSHMGWLLIRKHPEVKEKGKTIDLSDLRANPIVMFQHKYYYWLVLFFGGFLTTFIPYYYFGDSFKMAFCYATVYRYLMSVHITWCINSVAHLYGNKPYDKIIGPTDSTLMKYCGYGEGFHNYHHTFPYDYKAAELGDDVRNFTTMMIDMFAWFGWVTDRKVVPSELVQQRINRTGDGTWTHDTGETYKLFPNIPKKQIDTFKNVMILCIYIYLL